MAADRGAFVDQSQSLNIHLKEPTMGKITSMHFAGWKAGLKTGMYYLRTMAAAAPIQFTVDQEALKAVGDMKPKPVTKARRRHQVSNGYTSQYSAVPRPMYAKQDANRNGPSAVEANGASNGGVKDITNGVAGINMNKENVPPAPGAARDESVSDSSSVSGKDSHDESESKKPGEEEMKGDGDIYSDKVIACSIQNGEACLMCSS
ncbi:hypothetical protein KEM55_007983 [Ascosphaera atra]|nr:hypothetical protein KEM55_007983 [Ascosphaera atra]